MSLTTNLSVAITTASFGDATLVVTRAMHGKLHAVIITNNSDTENAYIGKPYDTPVSELELGEGANILLFPTQEQANLVYYALTGNSKKAFKQLLDKVAVVF